MSFDKLFVKKILEQAQHFEWSLQGMGMFRLYLSPEVRMHVWDTSFAVPNVSMIHDHPWHFTSHVISGRLTEQRYAVVGGEPNHHKQTIVCGEGGGPCGEKTDICLEPMRPLTISEGYSYDVKSTWLHQTIPKDGTVTIIKRTFLEDTEHAEVYFPYGEEWVSAEPRPAVDSEVYLMSQRALQVLESGVG